MKEQTEKEHNSGSPAKWLLKRFLILFVLLREVIRHGLFFLSLVYFTYDTIINK